MGKKNVDTIQDEAREGFDLIARLQGVSRREKTVTVYTDAATGAELGGVADTYHPGTEIVTGRRRWGIVGEQDELREKIKAALADPNTPDETLEALKAENAALDKKKAALLKKLDKTALVFTLQAVPDLVLRDTRRTTRKALGIKQKGIEGREEDYALEYIAQILVASVVSWTDNQTGDKRDSLDIEHARQLRDFLPVGQFAKLDAAISELSIEASIGNVATDSADF